MDEVIQLAMERCSRITAGKGLEDVGGFANEIMVDRLGLSIHACQPAMHNECVIALSAMIKPLLQSKNKAWQGIIGVAWVSNSEQSF